MENKKKVIFTKPLLVFKYQGDTIIAHNGKEELQFNKDELSKYQKKYKTIFMTGKDASISLEKAHDKYTKSAKALKEATKGGINMFKTGCFPKTAIALWEKLGFLNGADIKPDPISDNEIKHINNATTGSIQFGLKFTGQGHQYDFKSFYLSIMNDNNFLIPVKEGKQYTIKDFKDMIFYNNYAYGYYNCIIHKSGNPNTDRFFRFNKKNEYTNFDLMSADILGLKKELIISDNNCYIYTRKDKQLVCSSQVFRPFVQCVFKLKEKKIEGAKQLSTSLWGGLCSGGTKRVITLDRNEPQPQGEIINIVINNDDTISYQFNGDGFNYDWARIKPFLLSKGRLEYIKVAFKYSDVIVRSHTDSFTTTKKLDIETGDKLGDIAYEGYFNYSFDGKKLKRKKI